MVGMFLFLNSNWNFFLKFNFLQSIARWNIQSCTLCSNDFFKFSAPASVKFQCKKLAIFDRFVMAIIYVWPVRRAFWISSRVNQDKSQVHLPRWSEKHCTLSCHSASHEAWLWQQSSIAAMCSICKTSPNSKQCQQSHPTKCFLLFILNLCKWDHGFLLHSLWNT
jgi:hypothetical protein